MTNKRIFIYGSDIDWALDIDSDSFNNIFETTIRSDLFNECVEVDMFDDYYRLTINLEFDDVTQNDSRYDSVLSKPTRFKLMSEEEYSKLKKALDIFSEFTIEFYIDTDGLDEEFSLKFII